MKIKSEIMTSDAYKPEIKAVWEKILAPPHFGDNHPDAPIVAPADPAEGPVAPPSQPSEMVSLPTEVSSLSSALRAGLDLYEVI